MVGERKIKVRLNRSEVLIECGRGREPLGPNRRPLLSLILTYISRIRVR